MCRFYHFAAIACFLTAGLAAAQEPGPNPEVPELKVLDQFAGTWEGKISDGTAMKRTATWVLDGRFLKEDFQIDGSTTGLLIRGYDTGAKKYVVDYYDWSGNVLRFTGDWNAQDEALELSADLASLDIDNVDTDTNVVTKTTFPDDKTQKWHITVGPGEDNATVLTGTFHRTDPKSP